MLLSYFVGKEPKNLFLSINGNSSILFYKSFKRNFSVSFMLIDFKELKFLFLCEGFLPNYWWAQIATI